MNSKNHHRLTEQIEMHFVEVAKWKAKNMKEMKRLDKWMAYFSNKVEERFRKWGGIPTAITQNIKDRQRFNYSTVEALRGMRLSAMASEFEKQLSNVSTYGQLGFEDRFALLVDIEWNCRQANKLHRYVRGAHFSVPCATIEGIEYYDDRKLEKTQILRFATCKYKINR